MTWQAYEIWDMLQTLKKNPNLSVSHWVSDWPNVCLYFFFVFIFVFPLYCGNHFYSLVERCWFYNNMWRVANFKKAQSKLRIHVLQTSTYFFHFLYVFVYALYHILCIFSAISLDYKIISSLQFSNWPHIYKMFYFLYVFVYVLYNIYFAFS